MAEIKDCIGKKVKISKNSITIKGDDGKTCGVVHDIANFTNIQLNKQFEISSKLKRLDIPMGLIGLKNIFIKDNELYIFRNMKSVEIKKKFDADKAVQEQVFYDAIRNSGIDVIECIFI